MAKTDVTKNIDIMRKNEKSRGMLDLDKKIASIRSEDEEVDAKVDIRKQRDEGSGRLQEPYGCGNSDVDCSRDFFS
jgi:hypothetical protein